jgi:hypothetical protein
MSVVFLLTCRHLDWEEVPAPPGSVQDCHGQGVHRDRRLLQGYLSNNCQSFERMVSRDLNILFEGPKSQDNKDLVFYEL